MLASLTGARMMLLASASLASAGWGPDDFFPGTGYSAVPSGYAGDADCPCIDPFSNQYSVTNLGSPVASTPDVPATYDPGSGSNPSDCAWLRSPDYGSMCYPSAYGSTGCKAHDMDTSPECGGIPGHPDGCPDLMWQADINNPDCNSCASTWCWVDPRDCRRPNAPSSYFPLATYGVDGPRLTYSYETCGNVDTWEYQKKRLMELKKLEPIRISFPNAGSNGYTITKAQPGDPNGYGDTGHDGAFTRFVIDGLNFYNISYKVFEQRSASSRAFAELPGGWGSSYTSCVHEVALNRTDICIGEFWQTSIRLEMAAFTRALYSDVFHVLAWRTDGEAGLFAWLAKILGAAFQPFDPLLWFLLILMYVVGGLAMWVIEGHHNTADFPDQDAAVHSLVEGVFRSLQSFFGGEDHRFSPRTLTGKLVVMGLSLSSLVLISLYVAKITTAQIVIARTDRTAATELVKVINSGGKVCALNAQRNELVARIDDLPNIDASRRATGKTGNDTYYYGVEDGKELLWSMDSQPPRCGVGIIFEDAYDIMRTGWFSPRGPGWDEADTDGAGSIPGYPGLVQNWNSRGAEYSDRHTCDTKVFLRDSSFEFHMDNAMPVRKEAQVALTWLISQRIKATPFEKIRKDAQQDFVYSRKQPMCDVDGNDNTLNGLQKQITIQDGGGIVIISLLITFLAIVMFCFQDRFERKRRSRIMAQVTSTTNLANLLVEPPGIQKRISGMMTRRRKTSGDKNPAEDPESTAFKDDDINCVEQIISARHLTTERCHHKFHNMSKVPLEALCVSDVPMLLRLIRRSAKLGAAEVLGKDRAVAETPCEFFPSAWPEDQAKQLEKLNRKQGLSLTIENVAFASKAARKWSRLSKGDQSTNTCSV